jgi:hypothetical protein
MSKYELITDLCESKVFRSKSAVAAMGDVDKQNLLYSTMLGTVAGSLDTATSGWAKEYAGKTAAFSNFDFFRPSGTDLYVLLHDAGYPRSTNQRVIALLRSISRGTTQRTNVQQVLLGLERKLNFIEPRLRAARRVIANWDTSNPAARRAAVENIHYIARKISTRAEVVPYMKVLKGGPQGKFGKASTLKKAAALAGAGLAGFWLGKRGYDSGHKFTFGRRKEAVELDVGNMLAEDRATQLAYIVQKLPEHPAVEKVISVNYLADGISAFVRTKDGNAYEFEIRPARFAKGHEDKRGVTEEWEYRVEEIDDFDDEND